MQEYTGFAYVYDMFMDNVPYDEWAEYLTGLLCEYGAENGIVAELGCGTGNVTRRLAKKGYDMIGIDMSADMLQMAREKETTDDILYLLQDMREFELYGSVAAVVSICDSLNYITSTEELTEVFRLVENYLDPGGCFIFDFNTEYYYRDVLGEQTICDNRDTGSFIWDNYYDEDSHINEYDMTIYYRADINGRQPEAINGSEEKSEGKQQQEGLQESEAQLVFRRCSEIHYQRAYSLNEIKECLKRVGLVYKTAYTAFTRQIPDNMSERIYVVAVKQTT